MTLLDEWNKLKNQLEQSDAKELQRLIDAYGLTYENINPDIEALIELMQAQLDNGTLTRATINKSSAYNKLIKDIEHELDDYSTWMKTEVKTASTESAKQGLAGGRYLLLVALAGSLGVPTSDVPRELVNYAPTTVLDFLQEYLKPSGPLYAKIDELSGYHADKIAAGILERVGEGMNPRLIGEWITDAYGVGLTDSMRQMRTVQLYSYRQANNEVQIANKDLLEGVVWSAELDDRVCMSCVALHGQVFPVGSVCDDHHNGRCAFLPWVKGVPNPIEQTGEDWFKQQDENTQKSMMGDAKYEAFKENKFTFDKLTKEYNNDVFGIMKTEATLKDLLGE
jgi:hypothetical protein